MKKDRVGLWDMDGSLFNHDEAVLRELDKLASPGEEPIVDLHAADKEPHLKARIDLIRMQPGFWRNLRPINAGFALYLKAAQIGFTNQILTKGPATKPNAWTEKFECCRHHFGPDINVHICCCQDPPDKTETYGGGKGLVYGYFLYDDFPDYMAAWLKYRPRGWGFMPVTPHNLHHEIAKHPRVIMYDGSNDSFRQVAEKMQELYVREPGVQSP